MLSGPAGRHVVVVGAGIVGASVAYHTARAGATVTLVDAGWPGAGVTADSFGPSGVGRSFPESEARSVPLDDEIEQLHRRSVRICQGHAFQDVFRCKSRAFEIPGSQAVDSVDEEVTQFMLERAERMEFAVRPEHVVEPAPPNLAHEFSAQKEAPGFPVRLRFSHAAHSTCDDTAINRVVSGGG
ncbi:FAD-dependent oxidoreductase [Micromonospora sp. NPDC050187]|uniref:FAD-dependent oxidoreductase n=1 Tax=Micromonospora sp. NPDC050187 TaxID=3364277 RepID=UPI0037AD3029